MAALLQCATGIAPKDIPPPRNEIGTELFIVVLAWELVKDVFTPPE